MNFRALLFLVVLAVIIGFSALNWNAFMTPTSLDMGVASVQAPLGLVMLGLLGVVTAMFLAFVVYLQISLLFDARRHARELKANRDLADQAEASRFTELRAFLDGELNRQAALDAETRAAVLARLDQLDRDLRLMLEQSENTLAAHIGELEDRVERGRIGMPPTA